MYGKHNTTQSFKLYFLQNSYLAKVYTSASDRKGVGNVPFCESLFSSSVAFLIVSLASQKRRPCNIDFSLGER